MNKSVHKTNYEDLQQNSETNFQPQTGVAKGIITSCSGLDSLLVFPLVWFGFLHFLQMELCQQADVTSITTIQMPSIDVPISALHRVTSASSSLLIAFA